MILKEKGRTNGAWGIFVVLIFESQQLDVVCQDNNSVSKITLPPVILSCHIFVIDIVGADKAREMMYSI